MFLRANNRTDGRTDGAIPSKDGRIKKKQQKSEDTHKVDLSLKMATLHQFTNSLIFN